MAGELRKALSYKIFLPKFPTKSRFGREFCTLENSEAFIKRIFDRILASGLLSSSFGGFLVFLYEKPNSKKFGFWGVPGGFPGKASGGTASKMHNASLNSVSDQKPPTKSRNGDLMRFYSRLWKNVFLAA